MRTVREGKRETAPAAGRDDLVAWAEGSGRPRARGPARGGLRFVFYGRVSTEDWQDPVTSRARQREQAEALVRGYGAGMRMVIFSSRRALPLASQAGQG